MEIYNDILTAISLEITNNNDYREDGAGAKPTRVQLKSNLAYDKFARYLTELENKNMIKHYPLSIFKWQYLFSITKIYRHTEKNNFNVYRI